MKTVLSLTCIQYFGSINKMNLKLQLSYFYLQLVSLQTTSPAPSLNYLPASSSACLIYLPANSPAFCIAFQQVRLPFIILPASYLACL